MDTQPKREKLGPDEEVAVKLTGDELAFVLTAAQQYWLMSRMVDKDPEYNKLVMRTVLSVNEKAVAAIGAAGVDVSEMQPAIDGLRSALAAVAKCPVHGNQPHSH